MAAEASFLRHLRLLFAVVCSVQMGAGDAALSSEDRQALQNALKSQGAAPAAAGAAASGGAKGAAAAPGAVVVTAPPQARSIDEIVSAIRNGDSKGRVVGAAGGALDASGTPESLENGGAGAGAGEGSEAAEAGGEGGGATSAEEPTLAPETPDSNPQSEDVVQAAPPDADAVPTHPDSETESELGADQAEEGSTESDSEVPDDATMSGAALPPPAHPVQTPAPKVAGEDANDVVGDIKQGAGLMGGRIPTTRPPTAEEIKEEEEKEVCWGSLCLPKPPMPSISLPSISWPSMPSIFVGGGDSDSDSTSAPTSSSDTAVAASAGEEAGEEVPAAKTEGPGVWDVSGASGKAAYSAPVAAPAATAAPAAAATEAPPVATILASSTVPAPAATEAPTVAPSTLAPGQTSTMFWIGGRQPDATGVAAAQTVPPPAPPSTTEEASSSSAGSSGAGSSTAFWIIFAVMLCCCCCAAAAAVGLMLKGGKKKQRARDAEMDRDTYVSNDYQPVTAQDRPFFAEEAPPLVEEHRTIVPVAVAQPPVAEMAPVQAAPSMSQSGMGAAWLQPSPFGTVMPQSTVPGMFVFR